MGDVVNLRRARKRRARDAAAREADLRAARHGRSAQERAAAAAEADKASRHLDGRRRVLDPRGEDDGGEAGS